VQLARSLALESKATEIREEETWEWREKGGNQTKILLEENNNAQSLASDSGTSPRQ